jgi:predicted nucleic acid-binding protein
MMKNKAYDLSSYNFIKDEILLVDANIWLYLLPAPSDSNRSLTRQYSSAFKGILDNKVTIIINSLILSEYLNRYCRIEWAALHQATYPKFKEFRQSSDYTTVGQQAASFATRILKFCTKKDDSFTAANMTQILGDFESGMVDFNDGLIADSCCRYGWKLITHDGDFTEGGIDVLTTNQKLLANCS